MWNRNRGKGRQTELARWRREKDRGGGRDKDLVRERQAERVIRDLGNIRRDPENQRERSQTWREIQKNTETERE